MTATLAERVEHATGPDRAIDYDIAHLTGAHFDNAGKAPAFTRSIDAAMTLVPATYRIAQFYEDAADGRHHLTLGLREGRFGVGGVRVDATTPPLAICAAALRAIEGTRNG